MRQLLPQELKTLANACPVPLYVVGGSVRDFLAGLTPKSFDWDICSPLSAEEFASLAKACGLFVQATYRNTGTVKLQGKEGSYEYACFRSDAYVRGTHVPVAIYFTDDIALDAKRRDFTANAVYFHIQANAFCDPLSGIPATKEKRLTTVDNPEKVFGEDGLRLLRLARQGAQLGFTPDEACLQGAKAKAALIQDITPERIYDELTSLLTAEQKCGVTGAPYHGLTLLDETGVLPYILPELAKGKGLAQRADFHKYDVLEHSFRAVLYMEGLDRSPTLRLAALLHDVGKPLTMLRDGNAHAHAEEGPAIAEEILLRLKAPKRVISDVKWLIEWHMYDFDCRTSERKLRRFLVRHYAKIPDLLKIKQADFSACTDDKSKAPTRRKWEALLLKMQKEGVPFTLKALAVNGKDIQEAGFPPHHIARILNELLLHVAVAPADNRKDRLLKLANGVENTLAD